MIERPARRLSRKARLGAFAAASAFAGVLFLSASEGLGQFNFPFFILINDSAPTPTGLNSWENAAAGTANDYTVTYNIILIFDDATLSVVNIGNLTHAATGATLTTQWKFSTDGNGTSSTGVQNTAANQAKGLNTFVSASAFLSGGVRVDQVGSDRNMTLTVVSRGTNPYDFGNASDSTRAPNPGDYTASLNLRIADIP